MVIEGKSTLVHRGPKWKKNEWKWEREREREKGFQATQKALSWWVSQTRRGSERDEERREMRRGEERRGEERWGEERKGGGERETPPDVPGTIWAGLTSDLSRCSKDPAASVGRTQARVGAKRAWERERKDKRWRNREAGWEERQQER